MAGGSVNGLGVAAVAAGALLVWSGVKGASVTTSLRDLIGGKSPSGTQAYPLTAADATGGASGGAGGGAAAGNTGASNSTAAHNQAIAKLLAAPYGWSTGQNWSDLVSLWNQESGWNDKALNAGSGATGIPQLLPSAHPIPPGWSSPSVQIAWGLNYIAKTYGSPIGAWAHETSAGWY